MMCTFCGKLKKLEYKTNKEHLAATKYFGLLLNEQNFTGIAYCPKKVFIIFLSKTKSKENQSSAFWRSRWSKE